MMETRNERSEPALTVHGAVQDDSTSIFGGEEVTTIPSSSSKRGRSISLENIQGTLRDPKYHDGNRAVKKTRTDDETESFVGNNAIFGGQMPANFGAADAISCSDGSDSKGNISPNHIQQTAALQKVGGFRVQDNQLQQQLQQQQQQQQLQLSSANTQNHNPAMLATMQSQLMMGGFNPGMAAAATGFYPQMNPFFSQGSAAMRGPAAFLTGAPGNTGLMMPNHFAGMGMAFESSSNAVLAGMMAGAGAGGAPGNQELMSQQLAGMMGNHLNGGGRNREDSNDKSSSGSIATSPMAALARQQQQQLQLQQHQQLRLMQQVALAGGVGNSAAAAAMFGMGNSAGLGNLQSKLFGRGILSNRGVDALTPSSSSMTPAGISHQALYSREEMDNGEEDSADKNRLTLYMSCDDDSLSDYQCHVRKQIELFEAKEEDVESNAQGRNKPIVLGQVGIRCRHCSKIPPRHRTRGATYYPAKLHGLYQAAQNMASAHLCKHCQLIPDSLRQELIVLRDRKSSAGGGKQYWADGVRVLGVIETDDILRFNKPKQESKENAKEEKGDTLEGEEEKSKDEYGADDFKNTIASEED